MHPSKGQLRCMSERKERIMKRCYATEKKKKDKEKGGGALSHDPKRIPPCTPHRNIMFNCNPGLLRRNRSRFIPETLLLVLVLLLRQGPRFGIAVGALLGG